MVGRNTGSPRDLASRSVTLMDANGSLYGLHSPSPRLAVGRYCWRWTGVPPPRKYLAMRWSRCDAPFLQGRFKARAWRGEIAYYIQVLHCIVIEKCWCRAERGAWAVVWSSIHWRNKVDVRNAREEWQTSSTKGRPRNPPRPPPDGQERGM